MTKERMGEIALAVIKDIFGESTEEIDEEVDIGLLSQEIGISETEILKFFQELSKENKANTSQ